MPSSCHGGPGFSVYYEHPEKVAQGGSYQYFLDGMLAELPKGARVGVELGAIPMGMALYIQTRGLPCAISALLSSMSATSKALRRSP